MTLCSVPALEPTTVVDRLHGYGFTHPTLPLDDKTTQDLALIEIVAELGILLPEFVNATSPQGVWDQFQMFLDERADSYATRLSEPGTALLIDPGTDSLFLIVTENEPRHRTFCALGVPWSAATSSENFPGLALPREPDLFAVESSGTNFIASRAAMGEDVVTFDPAAVGERLDRTLDHAAVFAISVSLPPWGLSGVEP